MKQVAIALGLNPEASEASMVSEVEKILAKNKKMQDLEDEVDKYKKMLKKAEDDLAAAKKKADEDEDDRKKAEAKKKAEDDKKAEEDRKSKAKDKILSLAKEKDIKDQKSIDNFVALAQLSDESCKTVEETLNSMVTVKKAANPFGASAKKNEMFVLKTTPDGGVTDTEDYVMDMNAKARKNANIRFNPVTDPAAAV